MKRILRDIFVGIVSGQFIGFWMATLFSALAGANWTPSSPNWVAVFPSPMAATVVSALLWWAIGILFAVSSDLIFTGSEWGITRKTVVHFCITFAGLLPLSLLAGWYPFGLSTVLSFLPIFIIVYACIWTAFRLSARHTVRMLNERIQARRQDERDNGRHAHVEPSSPEA